VANFDQWKAKIEAAASGIAEDDAAIAKFQADSLHASFCAICKTVVDGFEAVINAGLPLETATALLEENLTMLIDNATANYQRMIATCPDEDRETLMNLCEYEVDFFKGWRETARGNNPHCLMYSELRS